LQPNSTSSKKEKAFAELDVCSKNWRSYFV